MKIKIVANTLFQLLGKAITAFATLLTTILIAKSYGPVGFGNFTLITTFVALFYLIADFGLNAVVLEKFKQDKKLYFKNLLGLRLLWSIILVFVSVSILSFLPQSSGFNDLVRFGIIIYSLSIVSQGLITSANVIFQNNLRYDLSTISLFLGSALNLLLIIFFTHQHFPLIFIILSFFLGNLLSAASSLYLSTVSDPEIKILPQFDKKIFREIFSSSLPLGITLVFNLIYFKSDTFILALTRTSGEVGNYGLAYRFFEVVLVFPTFLMNSLYPVFLKVKEDKERFKQIIQKSSIILISSSIILTIIFLILAPNLISISGGPSFTDSILALRILSLSFPSFFLSALFMWVLISLGKRKIIAIVYGLSMILNVLLNIIFIPQVGIPAAAITTGLCETITLITTYLISKKYI